MNMLVMLVTLNRSSYVAYPATLLNTVFAYLSHARHYILVIRILNFVITLVVAAIYICNFENFV